MTCCTLHGPGPGAPAVSRSHHPGPFTRAGAEAPRATVAVLPARWPRSLWTHPWAGRAQRRVQDSLFCGVNCPVFTAMGRAVGLTSECTQAVPCDPFSWGSPSSSQSSAVLGAPTWPLSLEKSLPAGCRAHGGSISASHRPWRGQGVWEVMPQLKRYRGPAHWLSGQRGSPHPLPHCPLPYLLTTGNQFAPSAQHKRLTPPFSTDTVFNCRHSAFGSSSHLRCPQLHITVKRSLIYNVLKCTCLQVSLPPRRRVSTPISQVTKLPSRC